jgi:hypothetical protein
MGISEGAVVYIKYAAPLGDPIVIHSEGSDFALRRETLSRLTFLEGPWENALRETSPAHRQSEHRKNLDF